MDRTLTDYGRIAFESYRAALAGLNVRGEPIPEWDELPESIQLGWICAAVSARRGHV